MVYLRICLVSMAAATNGLPLLAQTNLLMGLRVETGETLPASRLVLSERKSSQKLPPGLNATQRVLAFRGNQRQFSIPAGTKTLSLPQVSDGFFSACLYREEQGFLSNCEFALPQEAHLQVAGRSVTSGTQTLTLRKGTVIDLVLSGAGPSVGQDGGLHFQAGVGFSGGGFKSAVLTSRTANSITYSVTIPAGLSGTLMFDTRVALIGPDGRPVPQGRSSGLTVRGGPPRVTVPLTVSLLDANGVKLPGAAGPAK